MFQVQLIPLIVRVYMTVSLLKFFVGSPAFGDFLIEPYYGVQKGKYSQTYTGTGVASLDKKTTYDVDGSTFGGRLGLTMSLLFIAADYSSTSLEFDSPGGGGIKPKDWAAVAGAFLPMGLRIWGGYIFKSEVQGMKDGTGLKVGIGFSFLKLFSLNAEYVTRDWDGLDPNILPGSTFEAESKTYLFSLGLPLLL